MEKRLIWIGYSFVIGIATGFIFPNLSSVGFYNIFLYISLLGFLILILRIINSVVLFWLILLISSFSLGVYKYLSYTDMPQEHISKYIDNSFNTTTEIIGDIIKEPDIRENKINLTVKVLKIKKQGWKDWKILPKKAGNLQVSIRPTIGEYYFNVDYGDRIKVIGSIMSPFTRVNPAGFDYKRYLKRMMQVYGIMYIKKASQIKKIGTGGNTFIKWCLELKNKLLASIKKTMPYPESAFLGGVTLGARAGVPRWMKFQFQSTGVAHVLAVSGLHAGFVAVLALVFCNLLRLPPYPRLVVVAVALLIFCIITGARPATIRASLMYTIGLFIYTVGKLGLRKSTQLTIPLAAMIILFMNPVVLPEGSFTLSFMAVWSLAYLTDPVRAFFNRFIKGWTFITFFISYCFFIAIIVIYPELTTTEISKLINLIIILVLVNVFSYNVLDRYFYFEGLSLEDIAKGLGPLKGIVDFFYAQFAIQIGMMGPLSAIYFGRYPIAGVIANFIAIPLIGVIVQAGLIASSLHVFFSWIGLSHIGEIFATFLNMGNYWWSHLFLKMAEFFYAYFPYPYARTPSTVSTIIFYALVLSMALYEDLGKLFRKIPFTKFFYVLCLILPLGLNYYSSVYKKKKVGLVRITFFELGFGGGTLIEFPSGKTFLIDAGGSFIRTQDIPFALAKYHIEKIDSLIITNPRPENTLAIPGILKGYKVKNICSPLKKGVFKRGIKYKEFLKYLDDWRYLENDRLEEAQNIYDSFYPVIKDITERNIPYIRLKKGDVIWKEDFKGKKLILKVLHPPEKKSENFVTERDMDNNSLVIKFEYGDFSLLIPSLLTNEGEYFLLNNLSEEELSSKVFLASYHGWRGANSDEFLSAVNPELIVVQYSYGKGFTNFFYDSDLKEEFKKGFYKKSKVLITERTGAVIIETDGVKYNVSTVLKGKKIFVSEDEEQHGIEENL